MRSPPPKGISHHHEQAIEAFVGLCQTGAFGEDIRTNQAALARYLFSKEILVHMVCNKPLSLKLSTITTLINSVWTEEKRVNRHK